MAKENKTVDRIQAVWNILGGEEGVDLVISGKRIVVDAPPKPILRKLYADEVIAVEGCHLNMFEVVKSVNIETMFVSVSTNLEDLWTTEGLREDFCRLHGDKHCINGATFFLHKKDEAKPATADNLFVIGLGADGRLRAQLDVYGFNDRYVRFPELHHRLVVPALIK